jgi:hypothetical protein
MKKYFPFYIALLNCIIFICACKKSAETKTQNSSIEGTYNATGLWINGQVFFNSVTNVKKISGTTYETSFPDFAPFDSSWKFQSILTQ